MPLAHVGESEKVAQESTQQAIYGAMCSGPPVMRPLCWAVPCYETAKVWL